MYVQRSVHGFSGQGSSPARRPAEVPGSSGDEIRTRRLDQAQHAPITITFMKPRQSPHGLDESTHWSAACLLGSGLAISSTSDHSGIFRHQASSLWLRL